MFKTKFGAYNGGTWEELCQLVFKQKYKAQDYQSMPASPGDFGLEGFTLNTGWAFQGYCPNKHYERKELYEKQRDKITEDLGKLKTYGAQLLARLGTTKLNHWVFVTPEFDKNDLPAHTRTKEALVRTWKLPFLSDDFTVLLYDGNNYLVEINKILSASGQALILDRVAPVLATLTGAREDFENNVEHKCRLRLAPKQSTATFEALIQQLKQLTLENFLQGDGYFKTISDSYPVVHFRLVRLINEFEKYVIEKSNTWSGTADALTDQIRDGLERRITSELAPEFNETLASRAARHMVARWLAVCELDYE